MKIDVSRDTFRPHKHFTRVLMQQGRVQLDADWNEQAEIVLHGLRRLAADGGGHGWGPGDSFRVTAGARDGDGDFPLYVAPGRYYVAGMLCEHGDPAPPSTASPTKAAAFVGAAGIKHVKPHGGKADHVRAGDDFGKSAGALVMLWAGERVVTALEDSHLREIALGGPDTAARTQARFAPRVAPAPAEVTADTAPYYKAAYEPFRAILEARARGDKPEAPEGRLAARAHAPNGAADPCVLPSGSAYRGLENQLYRVEISTPGDFKTAKFVYAPDNGSLAAAGKVQGKNLVLEAVPAGMSGFARGDWAELTDDEDEPHHRGREFHKVTDVSGNTLTLDSEPKLPAHPDPNRRLKVRRWGAPGEAPVDPERHSGKPGDWLPVGPDGVQVRFDQAGDYGAGDYWLIPARTVTGDIEWPTTPSKSDPKQREPKLVPPHRPPADRAPLAFVAKPGQEGKALRVLDLRHSTPLVTLPGLPKPPTPLDPSFDAVKADGSPALRLFAAGEAAYRYDEHAAAGQKWSLGALSADLLDENGGVAGRHYFPDPAQPGMLVWEAVDGSRVTADGANTKSANWPAANPWANQLPWTLDGAQPDTFGLFNRLAQAQRLFVVSTPVPTDKDTPTDAEKKDGRLVKFVATYYFYAAR